MTRKAACQHQPVTAALCVDAGVQELNEMTIGRTDDPENPFCAAAFEAASLLGAGSRTPSGPADMAPRQKGRTHDRNRSARQISHFSLASKGPFSNRASFVNSLFLLFVAAPGSRFSPRSEKGPPQHLVRSTSAAMSTTGSHGIVCGPRPTCAAACTLAPSGNCPIRSDAPDGSQGLVRRLLASRTSEMARPSARCCA
jgi:hypothetical protein